MCFLDGCPIRTRSGNDVIMTHLFANMPVFQARHGDPTGLVGDVEESGGV
jgi:hypothetical protein